MARFSSIQGVPPAALAFGAVAALAVLVQFVTGIDLLGTAQNAVKVFGLGVVLVGAFAFIVATSIINRGDRFDARNSRLVQIANALRALAAGVAVVFVVSNWGTFVDLITEFWFLAPIAVGTWVLWTFLNIRTTVASTDTAMDRTRRRVQGVMEETADAVLGAFVLLATVVLAFASGALSAMSGLGDALAPLAPDIGYAALTGVGFAQLGGSFPGSDLIPGLSPMQWILLSTLIFAVALFWSDRR